MAGTGQAPHSAFVGISKWQLLSLSLTMWALIEGAAAVRGCQ